MSPKSPVFTYRSVKLLVLFVFAILLVGSFLYSIAKTIRSDRHLPARTATIHDRALRGRIVSQDGYTLALPHKTYKAVVYAPSIAPGKRKLFLRLFSIYSRIPEADLQKAFLDKKGRPKHGYVTLADTIDAGTAIHLKSLAYKLHRLGVFRPVRNRRGVNIVYGLDIIESGEQREFPLHDVMEPILGYVRDHDDGRYVEVKGVKGLERHFERYLTSSQDGLVRGMRDVRGTIIRNGASERIPRIDGMDLHLHIPLSLQRRVERAVDAMKEETGAQEILAGVMESRTGHLLALVSTERYDHIRQQDVAALNPKFAEYPYEPGSVIKPITLALALENRKVTPDSWFDVHGGKLKISEKFTISDDEVFDNLTATDIIVHSSNVGISRIAWRLSGTQMHQGLSAFGLGHPSGIDLSRELHGKIKPAKLLSVKIHRANQAYGYGMTATFNCSRPTARSTTTASLLRPVSLTTSRTPTVPATISSPNTVITVPSAPAPPARSTPFSKRWSPGGPGSRRNIRVWRSAGRPAPPISRSGDVTARYTTAAFTGSPTTTKDTATPSAYW